MKFMKPLFLTVFFSAALATGVSTHAQEKVNLRFGTAGIGAASYVYAAAMAEMVTPKLPPGSNIDVVPGTGSIGSLKLIQRGERELATTHSVPAAEACGGYGSFQGNKHDQVRVVIGGLDTWYLTTFVTKKSGVTSWDEIVAAKNRFHLLIVPPGGAGYAAAMSVLAAMGSNPKDIQGKGGYIESVSRKGVPERVRDGKADGWVHIVPRGHPTATQLVLINDMRVLPLPEKVIEKMSKSGWKARSIPANTWKGQTEPVQTVITGSGIIAKATVPENAIYQFTKTIIENAKRLPKIHAALGEFDPKKAADSIDCPLHPGAARYYREAGLIR